MTWVQNETDTARLAVDPAVGNIRRLEFRVGARILAPLHTAPWADDPDVREDPSIPPVEARLAGDFFCAPFGAADLDDTPAHGWTANSEWRPLPFDPGSLHMELCRSVMGANVSKTLKLSPAAPVLYQKHVLTGGEGRLTLAHHPMICLAGRGRFSSSPKRAALSPEAPLEPGRHRLACGQRVRDLSRFPAEGGGSVDLHALPIADRHEDFVTLVESEGSSLGWSAVVREVEDDIVFVLKDPSVLPVTMLWHSNGGRDYAPWSGRHRGVLGIEDGCAAGAAGYRAALSRNPVSDEGVPTSVPLGPPVRVVHAIGAVPRPAGWSAVQSMATDEDQLSLTDVSGETLSLPFDTEFWSS